MDEGCDNLPGRVPSVDGTRSVELRVRGLNPCGGTNDLLPVPGTPRVRYPSTSP